MRGRGSILVFGFCLGTFLIVTYMSALLSHLRETHTCSHSDGGCVRVWNIWMHS